MRSDGSEGIADAFPVVLGAMLEVLDEQGDQAYRQLQKHPAMEAPSKALAQCDPDRFHFLWSYPHAKLTGALVRDRLGKSPQAGFLFANFDFVDSHFAWVFSKYEGGACSSDKSKWAVRALARHFVDGHPIVVDHEQQYTFHLPKTVLKSEAEILEFFAALWSLHAGRPERYLKVLANLVREESAMEIERDL